METIIPGEPLKKETIINLQNQLPRSNIQKNEIWKKYDKKYWQYLIPKQKKSQYSYIKDILVSNLGNVKIQDNRTNDVSLIEQENDPNYPDGYLRLKGYASLGHIYRIVARTFILKEREEPKDSMGKLYPIHHIDNNGYNNSVENLIYVSPEEHAKIHFGKSK